MSECVSEFFIRNSKILSGNHFEDREVLEGVSLYEVIRVIEGVPVFLDRHLARLNNSASIVNLKLWMNQEEIKEKLLQLISVNNTNEGNIKIVFNFNDENTFLTYFIAHHYPSEDQYKNGVSAVLCFIERNNPNAKVINKELRKATDEKMEKTGAYEAILVNKSGNITEGSRSNIFMVRGNKVLTAPLEDVLPGITRDIIIEICKMDGIEFAEERIAHERLKELDAIVLTGTSPKVLPINKIENLTLSSSTNAIVQNIITAYNRTIRLYIQQNSV